MSFKLGKMPSREAPEGGSAVEKAKKEMLGAALRAGVKRVAKVKNVKQVLHDSMAEYEKKGFKAALNKGARTALGTFIDDESGTGGGFQTLGKKAFKKYAPLVAEAGIRKAKLEYQRYADKKKVSKAKPSDYRYDD